MTDERMTLMELVEKAYGLFGTAGFATIPVRTVQFRMPHDAEVPRS
jgi:hypothetical protein